MKMRRFVEGWTTAKPWSIGSGKSTEPAKGRRQHAQQRTSSVTALGMTGLMLYLLVSCKAMLTLMQQGGEQQLQEVLPPNPSPRVLIFALDGAGYHELMQAIRSGKTQLINEAKVAGF